MQMLLDPASRDLRKLLQAPRANLPRAAGEFAGYDYVLGHAGDSGNIAWEHSDLRMGPYTESVLYNLQRHLPVEQLLKKAAARTVEVHQAKQRRSLLPPMASGAFAHRDRSPFMAKP